MIVPLLWLLGMLSGVTLGGFVLLPAVAFAIAAFVGWPSRTATAVAIHPSATVVEGCNTYAASETSVGADPGTTGTLFGLNAENRKSERASAAYADCMAKQGF